VIGHHQLLPDNTTLILIDVQQAFENERWGQRNNPRAETNIGQIAEGLAADGQAGYPHPSPKHRSRETISPDQPGFAVKPEAAPQGAEPVITKEVNSAFIGTDLDSRLRQAGVSHLVICGLTTDHCVSTTARMAGNLGFITYVAADACATFERVGPGGRRWTADEMHQSALASLHEEFAQVVDTSGVLDLLRPASTTDSE
jgi:nicotinamidase-related amidase